LLDKQGGKGEEETYDLSKSKTSAGADFVFLHTQNVLVIPEILTENITVGEGGSGELTR
jgi:hypothetical protein